MYGFQQYKMVRSFSDSVFTHKINSKIAGDQFDLPPCGFSSRQRVKL